MNRDFDSNFPCLKSANKNNLRKFENYFAEITINFESMITQFVNYPNLVQLFNLSVKLVKLVLIRSPQFFTNLSLVKLPTIYCPD